MSISKEADNEIDIYGDLPNFSSDNTIAELENSKKTLENELKALQLKLKEIQVENNKLKKENEVLSINISSLYKTAACEIKRKDQRIQELQKEKDSILFRRHRNEAQSHSRRRDAQPEVIHLDNYQSSVQNEVCVIEDIQQDYTYQHADDKQYDENYKDELIAVFPEEDDGFMAQKASQKVPDTIFSRRKAQQLKLLVKTSDSAKNSTRVDVRSKEPEIIIEDSTKSQTTDFDRKNRILKSCNKLHDVSKAIVDVDTAHSPVLNNNAFRVKDKSSIIKNIDVSHKKTECSTNKHLDTRKTVESNVKATSKISELASESAKSLQSSRTEDVKFSKTTSNHKPKEHSTVNKSYRQKHSHTSSKDKRSSSDAHSHRKSSSSSRLKFSSHSSSYRSPLKNPFSPRSPKGSSVRDTSVSKSIKSLSSKTRLKDLDHKNSRSLKERHNHKKLENEGNKDRQFQEHKKADQTIVKSHISSKLIPDKIQPKITSQPNLQLVAENVSTKSKLPSDILKTTAISDSRTSGINQDIYMRSKSHNKEQNSLQQERLAKFSDGEHYSIQINNAAISVDALGEEIIIGVQTNKISHKEHNSKTLTVSSKPHENITEVQGNCGVLRQENRHEVITDGKTSGGEIPTNSTKLHEEDINKISCLSQKESISKVSQESGSSGNKNICEIPMDIDLSPKKQISDKPAANRQDIEDVPPDNEQHNENASEMLISRNVLYDKHVNKEAADIDPIHSEDTAKDKGVSASIRNTASDDSNTALKTMFPSLVSQVNITDSLLKSNTGTNNVTSCHGEKRSNNMTVDDNTKTVMPNLASQVSIADALVKSKNSIDVTSIEHEIQAENANSTSESVDALQNSVTTNQEDFTSLEKPDLSTSMHIAENSTQSSFHGETGKLKKINKNDSNIPTVLSNLVSEVTIADTPVKSKNSTDNVTSTESETQAENAKPTSECVEDLQDLPTNQEGITSSEKSDLSTNMHNEENSSCHGEKRRPKRINKDDSNITTALSNLISQVSTADTLVKSKKSTNNVTSTEPEIEIENAKPTSESVVALQDIVTNQEDMTPSEKSNLSTNTHSEENNALNSSHEEKERTAKRKNNASDDNNIGLKIVLPNVVSQVSIADTLVKSKNSTDNLASTEHEMQDENAKSTSESVEDLQDVTTNQEEVMSSQKSDLSTNVHNEENNTHNSCHEVNKKGAKRNINASDNRDIKDVLPNLVSQDSIADALVKSKNSTDNITTTEHETQAETAKPTSECVDALQDLLTNQEGITPSKKSDLSTNMHNEENSIHSSCHGEKRRPKRINKDDSNNSTALSNLTSQVSTADTLLKSKNITDNVTSTELETQAENAKPASESVDAVQDLVTNQEDITPSEKSDLSTNMHNEENDTLSSCHEEKVLQLFHSEKLQNAAMKDRTKNDSIGTTKNSVEIKPLERPVDAIENGQMVSSTVQTDTAERNICSGISKDQSLSQDRSEDCLLSYKDSNPSLQEVISKSQMVEKEHTRSVNESPPKPNKSISPTATMKKGNISFTIMSESGCFRRRKFKLITNDNNSTGASNVMKNTSDEKLLNEKLGGTKRTFEHLETDSSESPPVKMQPSEDPQREQLCASAIKEKSVEDSNQEQFESNSTKANEKNTSVTETSTSDKNNAPDLEEGEIEDCDSDENASEDDKKINKDMKEAEVLRSVIQTESNERKEQSRKYLEFGRKVRENRRKSHSSHFQEVARGNREKHYTPKKLFSHCKRRSPSELLIKDRNIKLGTKEKDQNNRRRSTSSEASRNTNEQLKVRRRTKENEVDIKNNYIGEGKKETKDKTSASSTSKPLLQNMHVSKPDLSAWTRLGNCSSNEGGSAQSSRKENVTKLNEDNPSSLKIPTIDNQTVAPVVKFIIKRRKVCNLQDSDSVPVVNICSTQINTIENDSCKSVHLKITAASNADMQTNQVNLIPPRKTNYSTHSKENLLSKTSTSVGKSGASRSNVNCSRTSADKTLSSQVSSDSSLFNSSSSSEYENNSDETWRPKRRRKRKRKNPKTEMTRYKAKEVR